MPRFKYAAINAENQKLSGSIDAADETEARAKLNNFGMSIIDMKELGEAEMRAIAAEKKLKFHGRDGNGKNVIGKIAADSEIEAYAKLKDEYQLTVIQIGENTDMLTLENLYQQQKKSEDGEKTAEDTGDASENSEERKIVDDQVNRVIQLGTGIVQENLDQISPDAKKSIEDKLDQLQRIRRSSNLQHVRATCKELLEFIKTDPLFVNPETKVDIRTKIQIDGDNLVEELSQTGLKQEFNLKDSIKKWYEKKRTKKGISWLDSLIEKVISEPSPKTQEDITIATYKASLKNIRKELRDYIKIWITAKNAQFRKNAGENIKKLWNTRSQAKRTIAELAMKQQGKIEEKNSIATLWTITGWLLTFYLLFYFTAIQIITKNFGLETIPNVLYIYNSTFIKYFLLAIFVLHAIIAVKMIFFKKNILANVVLYPMGIFIILLAIINL